MWPAFQAGGGPTILSGNPFIPTSVQSQMTALNLPSFRIGSMNYGLPNMDTNVNRVTDRYVVGVDGAFSALGKPWTWNAYYQYGKVESKTKILGALQTARYALAVDAVRNPTTGAIVCRSTLTSPLNGCSPVNPLGLGVISQAGLNYVIGVTSLVTTLEQDVFAASTQGEFGSTWAGPVAVALSGEYRKDTAKGVPSGGGPWFAGNFSAFDGSNNVKEVAVEALVPLARGAAFADNLELSLAGRYTDYAYSGAVETWKVGAVWSPVPSLRFRSTLSRDIRAPNFNELLAASNSGQRSVFDPFTNTTPQFFGENTGNPALLPEEGDTFEVGLVFQPSFIPGFSASIDYWDIELKGAVARPNDVQIITFCFQGRQQFCNNVERTNGVISKITQFPFNLASQRRTGIDVELSQNLEASSLNDSWGGQFSVNAVGTFYTKSSQDDGLGGGSYSTLGDMGQLVVGPPDWRAVLNVGYALGGFTGSLTGRAQSDGVLDARWIECRSGCPTSGAFTKTVEDNSVDGIFYLDGSVSYDFDMADMKVEAFFNVRNILNKDPSIVPQGPSDFTYVSPLSKGSSGFDLLGRQYLVGLRVRM
jgi:outer membrane receptor protein involved in Fe transport